jgi:hypothetical protein
MEAERPVTSRQAACIVFETALVVFVRGYGVF